MLLWLSVDEGWWGGAESLIYIFMPCVTQGDGRTGSPGFQLVALGGGGSLWGWVGAGVLCLVPVVGGGGPAGGLGALAVSAVGLCIVSWAGFRVASGWAGALGVECGWMVGCKCMDFVTTGLRTRK